MQIANIHAALTVNPSQLLNGLQQANQAFQQTVGHAHAASNATQNAGSQMGGAQGGALRMVAGLSAANLAASAVTAALGVMTMAVSRAIDIFAEFGKVGIAYARDLEDAQIAIAALIAANRKLTNPSADPGKLLAASLPIATEQMKALRVEALKTTAEFGDLVKAFQAGLGPGLAAGLNPEQVRKISTLVGQAAKTLTVPGAGLPQEIKALLSGDIDQNAAVAKALNVSGKQIKELIAKTKQDGKSLFDFLEQRLEVFKASGELAANTLSGLFSNIQDTLKEAAAGSFEKTFQEIKRQAAAGLKLVLNVDTGDLDPKLRGAMRTLDEIARLTVEKLGGGIQFVISGVKEFSVWLSRNESAVQGVRDAFDAVLVAIGDAGKAILEAMSFKEPKDGLQAIRAVLVLVKGLVSSFTPVLYVITKLVTGIVALGGKLMSVYDWIADSLRNLSALTREWAAEMRKAAPISSFVADRFGEMLQEVADRMGGGTPRQRLAATSSLRVLRPTSALRIEPELNDAPPPSGTGGNAKRKMTDAAREAERLAKAQADAIIAAAERAASEQAGKIELNRVLTESLYRDNALTVEGYYAKVRALDEQEFQAAKATQDARVNAAENVLKRLQAAKAPLSEITEAETAVADARAKSAELVAQFTARNKKSFLEESDAVRQLQGQFIALRDSVLAIENPTQAAVNGINDELSEMLQTMQKLGDPSQFAQVKAWIEQLRTVRTATANTSGIQGQIGMVDAQAEAARLNVETQVLQGTLSRRDAEREINAIQLAQAAALRAMLPSLREAANVLPPEQRTAISLFIAQVENRAAQAAASIRTAIQETTKALADGLEQTIGGALANFRGDFDNLWRSILGGFLQMLQTMIAKAAAANLASLLFGGGRQGGGGWLGWLGMGLNALLGFGAGGGFGGGAGFGAAAGAGTGAGSAIGNIASGLVPRAKGGPVTGGKPYLVGEVGAELFVPRGSGTIVPSGKMSGGGMVNNFYFSVTTPDGNLPRRSQQQIADEALRGLKRAQRMEMGLA